MPYQKRQNSKTTDKQQTILFDCDETPLQAEESSRTESIEELNRQNLRSLHHANAASQAVQSMRFISFGSGSSGNCSYVGTETQGVLIDAGVDGDKVFKALAENGITPDMVKGVLLTHDHGDHVRYAYQIARHNKHIHIYCTPRVLNGIFRRHSISRRLKEVHVSIFKEIPFTLAGMQFTAFEVSHDGTDNAGFFVEYGSQRFAIATDLGCITDRAKFYMTQADYLMIEANYDAAMLDGGRYPEYLKNRIRATNGHLDNKITADFVANQCDDRLRYIFLCHLSNDNNTPEIARHEVCAALEARGRATTDGEGLPDANSNKVTVVALPRFDTSRRYVLRKSTGNPAPTSHPQHPQKTSHP